jgi:AAA domain (dynein-related subfamily)
MNIAMFVETYELSMGEEKRQTLLVPFNGGVRVYSRITDGAAGKGNRWEETTLDELFPQFNPDEYITVTPVGVRVTSADFDAIKETGWSPVLSTKAMAAYNKAPKDEEIGDVKHRIMALASLVAANSERLENNVTDLRRERGSHDESLLAEPTQTIADAAPDTEAQPSTISGRLKIALATIPPIEMARKYVSRKLAGGKTDFETFDHARKKHYEVLIYGPTGPGKTTAVIAWAAARGLRLATISGNAALEPSQLIGKYVPDGNGAYEWIDGPVTDVVRNGGVLLLDEFNFISAKIYTVLYSLLDSRRCLIILDHHGETINAHEDLTIFATMNPDYVGTAPLNFAMRNRFTFQIPWDYDDEVEEKLIESKALHVIKKQLRAEAAKGELETPVSTNMFMELEETIKEFNYEFAVANFVAHFDKEEQDKVSLVMMTHDYNLRQDFGLLTEDVVLDKGADDLLSNNH